MSARANDDERVAELYRVICETEERVKVWEIDKASFLENESVKNRSIADSLLMCVFRATEEAGNLSKATKDRYPSIEWHGIYTMRNILAHDYGNADKEIICASVEQDFPELKSFCKAYAKDHDFEFES